MRSPEGEQSTIEIAHLPPDIFPTAFHVPGSFSENNFISAPLREAREMFERDYLLSQVKRFNGNISKTAEFVGMERSALHRKLKQLGIGTLNKHNDDESSSPTGETSTAWKQMRA
jgi:two-component system nitrogen regulation response regulator NtrX